MNKRMWMLIFSMFFLCLEIHSNSVFLSSFRGDDNFTGTSQDSPFKTFSRSYNEIQNGDTIFCEGCFTWSEMFEVNYVDKQGILINKSVSIYGLSSVTKTIFQADFNPLSYESCIFTVDRFVQLNIKNLIIQNGYLNKTINRGAGIYMSDNSILVADSCNFSRNMVLAEGLSAIGGVVYAILNNNLKFNHCYFSENYAKNTGIGNYISYSNSGVIHSFLGNLKIENSTFYKNSCQHYGGVFYFLACSFQIENCTFIENEGGVNILQLRYPAKFSYLINNTFVNNDILKSTMDNGLLTCSGNETDGKTISIKNNLMVNNYCLPSFQKIGIRCINMDILDAGANYLDTLYMSGTDSIVSLMKGNVIVNDIEGLRLDSNLSVTNDWDVPVLKFKPSSVLADAGNNEAMLNSYTLTDSLFLQEKDASGIFRDDKMDVGAYENKDKIWMGGVDSNWSNPSNWLGGCASGKDVDFQIQADGFSPVISSNVYCNSFTVFPETQIYLENADTLNIGKELLIKYSENTEFKMDGKLILGTDCKVKTLLKIAPDSWRFLSFPYPVVEIQRIVNGNLQNTIWGDLNTENNSADFYIAAYDGFRRAFENVSNGNWVDTPDKLLNANEGYILATNDTAELCFISDNKVQVSTLDSVKILNNRYFFDAEYFNQAWNFKGNPFFSSVDLKSVLSEHSPLYFFDGENYQTIAFCDSKTIKPFESFLFQAYSEQDLLFVKNYPKVYNLPKSEFSTHTQIKLSLFSEKSEKKVQQPEDFTRIYLCEDAREGFEQGKDAFKILSPQINKPQIFTLNEGMHLSFNYMPSSEFPVPLTVKLTNDLPFVLKMEMEGEQIDDLWLFDSQMKPVSNLSAGQFVFNTPTNFFEGYIGFNSVSTTENLRYNPKFRVIDMVLQLENFINYDQIKIYDIHGQIVVDWENPKSNLAFKLSNHGVYFLLYYCGDLVNSYKIVI